MLQMSDDEIAKIKDLMIYPLGSIASLSDLLLYFSYVSETGVV
ncbi:hypothetical protein PAE9249_01463 [Paenibacillus sp. CECT 9249]|nr:hypothetical protein PAE9249_01463 [Paenibacillus sp. CECT 9249]